MRVAVTGAAGFVGRSVAERFRELGWTVHGYDLRSSPGTQDPTGAAIRAWDVSAGRLPGAPPVDVVVHAAAVVSPTARPAVARQVNVTGTMNVAASFGDARLVHISSCSVYDPWHAQVNAAEDEAPEPDSIRWTNSYGRTKAQAERWLEELRPDAVRLRPHGVYGQGDTTVMPRAQAAVRHGVLAIPGSGHQLHSITWVQNLVEACRLACRPGVPGGAYNIADPAPMLLAQVLASVATRPGGTPPRVRALPVAALLPVALGVEATARLRTALTGRAHEPELNRYAVEHLGRERTFDISKARGRLGYEPAPSTYPAVRAEPAEG